jgi:hypothetical protein
MDFRGLMRRLGRGTGSPPAPSRSVLPIPRRRAEPARSRR